MTKEPGQTAAASAGADAFISRWSTASASERAHSQIFLAELCDVLGVPRPDPAHTSEQLTKSFARAKPEAVAEILETLVTLGRARKQGSQFTR